MIDYQNPVIEFSAEDRCDRCGARAYALAHRDGMELFFCGHHINDLHYALTLDGWKVDFDVAGLDKLVETDYGVLV